MRDHTKLRAFQLADELVLLAYQLTAKFPDQERFGLMSQMRLVALSAASNIVDGCVRSTSRDYYHFLETALGAAQNLAYQATIAHRLGYISDADFQLLELQSTETCKALNGILHGIRR